MLEECDDIIRRNPPKVVVLVAEPMIEKPIGEPPAVVDRALAKTAMTTQIVS